MHQIQRTKPFEDTIEFCNSGEVLRIDYRVSITPDFAREARKLQVKIIDLQRRSKTEQEFENLGHAIVDLFELIFGAENTQKIISFYEGDYANMLIDLFPYLRNTVFEELNRRTAARIKDLKKQYR
jgi:hypothetical protein